MVLKQKLFLRITLLNHFFVLVSTGFVLGLIVTRLQQVLGVVLSLLIEDLIELSEVVEIFEVCGSLGSRFWDGVANFN